MDRFEIINIWFQKINDQKPCSKGIGPKKKDDLIFMFSIFLWWMGPNILFQNLLVSKFLKQKTKNILPNNTS